MKLENNASKYASLKIERDRIQQGLRLAGRKHLRVSGCKILTTKILKALPIFW